MRVTAKSVLGQKTHSLKINDYIEFQNSSRMEKIDLLRIAALDFLDDIFLDLEVPSLPVCHIGAIRGMEGNTPLEDASGYLMAHASFYSNNGRKIRFDVMLPYSRGEFYRPSVSVVNGHKQILSQATLDQILENTETIAPTLEGSPYSYSRRIYHQPVVHQGPYHVPELEIGYFEDAWERY